MKISVVKVFAFVILCIAITQSVHAEDLWVVASQNFATKEISKDQAREAFLGEVVVLDGGKRVEPLDRHVTPSADTRARFYQALAGMSLTQLKSFWSRRIFTGAGYPPPVTENTDSLKKALASDATLISFMESSEIDSSVKKLLKVDENEKPH